MKRLFKFLLVLFLLGVIAAVAVVYLSRQRPDWYPQAARLDPARLAEAGRRAEQKLSATLDWASGGQAAETRARTGTPDEPTAPGPTARPPAPSTAARAAPPAKPLLTISFTEEELNAIFQEWRQKLNWEQAYGQHLSDPAIVLHEGRIILAGTVKEIDRVVSLHFHPQVTPGGELHLDLERVMAGRLAMPQVLFESYKQRLVDQLAASLPAQQRAARIAPDGSVNEAMINATMSQLLLDVIQRRPAEPALFVPANGGRSVPVTLTDAKVDGDAVTLTVELMDATERQALLRHVRERRETKPQTTTEPRK